MTDSQRQLFRRTCFLALSPLLLALVTTSCGDEEEVAVDVASQSSASPAASPNSIDPATPSPSPIPDETLLAELRAIPLPPGAAVDGGPIIVSVHTLTPYGAVDFRSQLSAETVTSFYRSTLPPAGWVPEGEPVYASSQKPGDETLFHGVQWRFVKGDLRLLLGGQISAPDIGPLGPSWVLTLQPVWFGLSDAGFIPAPPTDTTPIPIGPDYLEQ